MPVHRCGHMPTADPVTFLHVQTVNVMNCTLCAGLFDKSSIK